MQPAFLPTLSPKLETETSHTGLPLLSAERNLEGNSSDLALTFILEWDEFLSVFLSTDCANKPQAIILTLRAQFNCLNIGPGLSWTTSSFWVQHSFDLM